MDCTATQSEPVVTIAETTELRWFIDGALPPEILAWFAPVGTLGLTEERVDSYRIDDQVDVGVKRRFGSTLELKSRRERPEAFATLNGSHGQVERWTRWSPADEYVEIDEDAQWVDVEKAIHKRRFDADGRELPIAATTRDAVGRGCDAEVVAVWVDGEPTWSVAFSAFGPLDLHRALLRTAADALFGDEAEQWGERLAAAMSCGYPEWLIRSRP